EIVPAAARFKEARGRNVGHRIGGGIEPRTKLYERAQEACLLGKRKADRHREPQPGRRRLVDRQSLRPGDLRPWIAIGRVQPAAAEVDWEFRAGADSPGPPAEPRP